MRPLRPDEPRVLGPYRLLGVLGAGGMGQVWLGVAPDGRLAAIKQVHAALAGDDDFRQRFAREVDASRRVSGAHTAAVLDADPAAPAPWLASLFVPGPALDTAVARAGPLPLPSVRRLAVGLAVALREIHRVGLVHRDLKPANVLLAEDGPRVIDFGIAHAVAEAARKLTATGSVIGSPGFMSPEQVHGAPITPASDVFSLGAVLTHAATGAGPFGEGVPAALLHRVAFGAPDLGRVPLELRGLVGACLVKDPRARPLPDQVLAAVGALPPADPWLPAPVAALIGEQQRAARALAAATTRPAPAIPQRPRAHPGGPPPVAVPPPPRRRHRRSLLAGALALVIGLGVVLGVVLTRPRDLDPAAAAELVDRVARSVDPPEGYERDPEERTLAEQDPARFDPSRTYFACVVQDPPTPSEEGVVAAVEGAFAGTASSASDRVNAVTAVAYVRRGARDPLFAEIRARINDCIEDGSHATLEGFRPSSSPRVSGAREQVGFHADYVDGELPVVFSCEFTRVDAIFLRACAFTTTERDSSGPAAEVAADEEIGRRAVAVLTELTDAARQAQAE